MERARFDNKIGYTKVCSTKVVRTEHIIAYKVGMQAHALKVFLSKVPDEAVFEEWGESEDDAGIIELVFSHEEEGDA